ncbi:MaoC family dehydratase [Caulobacter segnis]|uniref:MaoC family dehydratase n=1 Tax=Caulobacter segnis TaxID=88688 RepID=UPI001CC1B166|nr:MaoC family dehydratase N-terminal domain-containing protein [Caulobacter segnis]UAL10204.1 MaoC family dehydratase N-terminal domain-containing protein [Caulobacter segnis]
MSANTKRFEHLLVTKKQQAYAGDFLSDWRDNELWEDLVVGQKRRHPEVFVVEEEDVLNYNRAIGETHPLYVDPEFARHHAPRGTILVHPVFTTTIGFWFAQPPVQGSWIRTPGARNPFQRIEYRERIHVGDHISLVQENHDRFVRRGKGYVTTHLSLRDQDDREKAACLGTLILPLNLDEVAAFATA